MALIRDLDGLLEDNRQRAMKSTPRTRMHGRETRHLRARRPQKRKRDGFAVRVARLLLVFAVVAFGLGLWQQPVREVVVDGNVLYEGARIEALAASLVGERWITFDAESAVTGISGLDWVHSVQITRQLPDAVRVEIEESFPVARTLRDDRAWGVGPDGRAAPLPAHVQTEGLPWVDGLFADDGTVDAEAAGRLQDLVSALKAGGWPFAAGLERIDLRAPDGLSLRTGDGVEIRLGRHDTAERIRTAATAWSHLAPAPGDRLDLRFARQAVLTRAGG